MLSRCMGAEFLKYGINRMSELIDLMNKDSGKQIGSLYEINLSKLTLIYNDFHKNLDFIKNSVRERQIVEFISLSKDYCVKLYTFIKKYENYQYLTLGIAKTNLIERLKKLGSMFDYWLDNSIHDDMYAVRNMFMRITGGLRSFFSWFNIFDEFVSNQKQSDKLVNKLKLSVEQAQTQAKNFETAINAVNGKEVEIVYASASEKFLENARIYEALFYLLLGGSVLFTIIHLNYSPYSEGNRIHFILIKVLTFTMVLTLGTLFLRKASHLRKLHDKSQMTSLELQALPLYLKNVDKSEHTEIYKNLAEKYFGKELDQTQNDKIGDLMKDQITAGTELIKASAELVKNAKTISNSVDKTKITKTNNTSTEDKSKPDGEA